MTPAALVKSLRDKMSYTQVELAEWLGVSHKTVSRWELGTQRISPKSLAEVKRLYDDLVSQDGEGVEVESLADKDLQVLVLNDLRKALKGAINDRRYETVAAISEEIREWFTL